jgi:ligand-binding sensor domain-containing protein
LTNVEGLSNLEITAILSDDKGRVWFGGANGLLDIYNTETGEWVYNKDIFLAQQQNKKINGFIQKGDSVYILTDFGISVYNTRVSEYKDTYVKLGEFAAFTRIINMVLHAGKIVASTLSGIAIADQNNTNLTSPTEWVTFSIAEHFENNSLIDVIYFNDALFFFV